MLSQRLFVLLRWLGSIGVCVCVYVSETVHKWAPPIYIKYGIFIRGLFAAAEGKHIHLWTVAGGEAGGGQGN